MHWRVEIGMKRYTLHQVLWNIYLEREIIAFVRMRLKIILEIESKQIMENSGSASIVADLKSQFSRIFWQLSWNSFIDNLTSKSRLRLVQAYMWDFYTYLLATSRFNIEIRYSIANRLNERQLFKAMISDDESCETCPQFNGLKKLSIKIAILKNKCMNYLFAQWMSLPKCLVVSFTG